MLTTKGYLIPKYLYKRKIELLREKVIRRKYGYLFYRKTVSNLLPSQAIKIYEMKIKRKCFKRWVSIWYEERIEWKIILRSEIHYKLTLTQNALRKWKYFHLQRKSLAIKKQISVLHYECNCEKQLIGWVLYKWKFFIQRRLYRKYLNKTAINHYKMKVYPEFLRDYFTRWILYTKWSKRHNSKLKTARHAYETHLISKCLKQLLWYANDKKNKKTMIMNVEDFYIRNFKCKCLQAWKGYTKFTIQEKQNNVLACTHYYFQLQKRCLSLLISNRVRNKMIRNKTEIITNIQNRKLLRKSFAHLQLYVIYIVKKRKKVLQADNHHVGKLQKVYFLYWQSYITYRKNKIKIHKQLLDHTMQHLRRVRMKYALNKWRQYQLQKQHKKCRLECALKFSIHLILRQAFVLWSRLLQYKNYRRMQQTKATLYYQNKVMRVCLKTWREFIKDNKLFKLRLDESKKYYHNEIVLEGLQLIIKAGFIGKQQHFETRKAQLCKKLFLAYKYSGIWKRKVLYRGVLQAKKYEEDFEANKENRPRTLKMEWVPICCITPRISRNAE